jgi:DNA-directed RNA polymerase specialized sigma24 family protein
MVALVACERRELLLAVHRHRLRREELEDCYSQATLELLLRAGRPERFASGEHIANALEQRLCSRIQDRRRALAGRSPIEAATARALPICACDARAGGSARGLVDERADVERIALLREELDRIARFSRVLTRDQRLLLATELGGEQTPAEFCSQHGWSLAKYRKVGQRARARLSALLADEARVPFGGRGRISAQDSPMHSTRPTHRRVPRDTADRTPTRSGGQARTRSDRETELPPARLPVAGAPATIGARPRP